MNAQRKNDGRVFAERIRVHLPPATLIDLDDYCLSARTLSRSGTIRYLVRLVLKGEQPPPRHLSALSRMRTEQDARGREYVALLEKQKDLVVRRNHRIPK